MARPANIAAVDTLIGFRGHRQVGNIAAAKDQGKRHPAEYMFKDIPKELSEEEDRAIAIDDTVRLMDKHNIAVGLISLSDPLTLQARQAYPDRFVLAIPADGNEGMDAVRKIQQAKEEHDIRAVSLFPAGVSPQIPIDDKHWYPIYAKCVELDLAVFCTVGIPGPRVPMKAQHVELVDEVCYDFPELKFVMRHGGEPWEELAVKLMLKWPNLYYSTSAFAPKYYPKAIIDYANTRGADKIIYAGYFPFGIELDRTFSELENVPFKDDVWPKFLRDNASRVLGIDVDESQLSLKMRAS